MSPATGTLMIGLLLAVALLALGRWALRGGGSTAVAGVGAAERDRRLRTIRRGGWACVGAGAVVGVAGVVAFMSEGIGQ